MTVIMNGGLGVERVRVLVGGRVQGVFFRATCASLARERGVAGSVRNLPDGRVEVILEGRAEAVEAMVDWCRHGPPGARVGGFEVHREPPVGVERFEITG